MERMMEEMRRISALPFEERVRRRREEFDIEDLLKDPFEEMLEWLERESPEEYRAFVEEIETPEGRVKRIGPFIYGFAFRKEPGKEPEIMEFGNIRPTMRRFEPIPHGEREPLVDVIEQENSYEVVAELPGVEKENINLHATENSLEIRAENDRKYYKEVKFDSEIIPESAEASYKNGILSVKLKKKEVEKKKKSIPIR